MRFSGVLHRRPADERGFAEQRGTGVRGGTQRFSHPRPATAPLSLGKGWSDVPDRRMEDIVRVIHPLEIAKARIVDSEGQRNALLLPLIQETDVPALQGIGRKGPRAALRPLHMSLTVVRRLGLPGRDEFDHHMVPTQPKGRLGDPHATRGPMEVMDRDGGKRRRELPRLLDESLNRLDTESV